MLIVGMGLAPNLHRMSITEGASASSAMCSRTSRSSTGNDRPGSTPASAASTAAARDGNASHASRSIRARAKIARSASPSSINSPFFRPISRSRSWLSLADLKPCSRETLWRMQPSSGFAFARVVPLVRPPLRRRSGSVFAAIHDEHYHEACCHGRDGRLL